MKSSKERLALAFATVSDLIRDHAAEKSDHPALVHEDESLTYGALDSRLDQISAGLQRDGVEQRATIAIVSATTIESTALLLGALRIGAVPTPISPSSTTEQIAAIVRDSGALIVFMDDDIADRLPPLLARKVRLSVLSDWLPSEGVRPAPVVIQPTDAFNLIYSSGTTGTPKGIVHTHAMRWAQLVAYQAAGFGDAVTLVATPLYSNTTLVSLLPTLAYGGTAVLLGKFEARRFLEVSERERVTHAMLVPIQYQRIMALPDFDAFNLSSFLFKTCTSAPFPAPLKADVVKRWPGMLVEIYGMTEGGGTCILLASAYPDKLHTVGQPAPGNDIRLIDDQGREVAMGEIGEVVGRSAIMMAGYHHRDDAMKDVYWRDADGHTFIRHGDLGRFDEDGFLELMGRSKDMIISGGFNIYPPDLEKVLLDHPDVAEAAVIGVPSEIWGETPFAFYVARPGTPLPSDLTTWANFRLGKTQRLAGAASIDEMPRNSLGKVLKIELRDIFDVSSDLKKKVL